MTTAGLYGDLDMTAVLCGEHARHAPAWMYVQDAGPGVVSFVGASRVQGGQPHPLRYGSPRTHLFVVGELVVRPRLVVATDTLRGMGLAMLATHDHDVQAMLADGEILHAAARQ